MRRIPCSPAAAFHQRASAAGCYTNRSSADATSRKLSYCRPALLLNGLPLASTERPCQRASWPYHRIISCLPAHSWRNMGMALSWVRRGWPGLMPEATFHGIAGPRCPETDGLHHPANDRQFLRRRRTLIVTGCLTTGRQRCHQDNARCPIAVVIPRTKPYWRRVRPFTR